MSSPTTNRVVVIIKNGDQREVHDYTGAPSEVTSSYDPQTRRLTFTVAETAQLMAAHHDSKTPLSRIAGIIDAALSTIDEVTP